MTTAHGRRRVTPPEARHPLLRALATGVSAGLLGLVVALAVAVVVVPAAVGGRALTVLSGSMEPQLPIGTLVVVRPTPADDIRIGDVLTYQAESGEATFVTHRVVARASSGQGEVEFTTQGDANSGPDALPVQEIQVVGTVWYAVPVLGYLNTWINGDLRPAVLPVLVLLLLGYAAVMTISWARDRRPARRPAVAAPASGGESGVTSG